MCIQGLVHFSPLPPYLLLETSKLQEAFLSTTSSVLTGKSCARYPASTLDVFLWRDACVSSIQIKRPILNKVRIPPP
jgi:hypothetical protein